MTADTARRRQLMARWHRRIAVFVAVWLIVLALTGILVNHAHDWRLDTRPLPSSLQAWAYGIEAVPGAHCDSDKTTGVDCLQVFARLELPRGALLLSADNIYLLNDEGQLVEQLLVGLLGLGELQSVLQDGSRIYLRDADSTVLTNSDLMDYEVLDPESADRLNDRSWTERSSEVEMLTWERLVLDVHAARFLGPLAKWFNDLVAVLILVLVGSGLWLYKFKLRSNGNGGSSPPA